MTDAPAPRRTRLIIALIVGALVLVLVAVTAVGLITAGGTGGTGGTGAPTSTAAAPGTATSTPSASASTSATPRPSNAPPTVKPTATPTPQPTRTASISKPTQVPITKALTASVVKLEAVTGVADGPGEIGGPSVRFTIRITNTTGKTYSLINTVVNAYYGSDETPAVQLRMPGGKDFPTSVKNGATASGVYVFNIPKKERGLVKVTVDTSVQNPVIAFSGAAPR